MPDDSDKPVVRIRPTRYYPTKPSLPTSLRHRPRLELL